MAGYPVVFVDAGGLPVTYGSDGNGWPIEEALSGLPVTIVAAGGLPVVEGVGFTPLSLFATGRQGAWYDTSDKSTLFQDVAATTPVTASGQEVRYIGDKSGNGNHLTILTTGTPGIYREANGHGYVECAANGISFKTTNNKTLQMPRYIAAAYRKTTMEDNAIFGIIRGANDMFALRGHAVQNRSKSIIWGSSIPVAGIPNPQSPPERGPLNSLVVEDALAVVGAIDIGANGYVEATAATNWLVGSALTSAIYGLNMIGTASTSNTNEDFYGGVILEAEPTPAERAATVRYLRSRIERPVGGSDINILILGDSTGDKVPTNAVSDLNGEWAWRFALEKIAADDATAFVGFRTYDTTNLVYGPEIVVQQGTGGPTYRIYNCSVAGSSPADFIGARYNSAIATIPAPQAIMWNFGHNMTGSPVTTSYTVLMDPVRATWPGRKHLAIRQNPWKSSNSMAGIIAAFDTVVATYGDIAVADVYQRYIDNAKPSTWYASGDEVHPSMPIGVDEWMPLVNAAYATLLPL